HLVEVDAADLVLGQVHGDAHGAALLRTDDLHVLEEQSGSVDGRADALRHRLRGGRGAGCHDSSPVDPGAHPPWVTTGVWLCARRTAYRPPARAAARHGSRGV